MQPHSAPVHIDPLDILRRFVTTPLRSRYRVGSVCVTVQTNDPSLFPALPHSETPASPPNHALEWKLIRDADSRGLLQPPMYLNCRALTIVAMGSACLLGLDRERRELLCFVGADVDERTHREFLVPFLCRMTKEACSEGSRNEHGGWDEEDAHE